MVCLDVWMWILCGYYYWLLLLEFFLGGSGGMEVDIMWILLFARMFLDRSWGMEVDIMWILLFARMFLGGFLDVWMWISPNEKRERPPVPCCSPWDMSGTRMVYFFYFHRLHHHKSSFHLPSFNFFIFTHRQCNFTHKYWKSLILLRSKFGSRAKK